MHYIFRWGGIATMAFAIYLFASNAFFWIRADSTIGAVVAQQQMETPRNLTIQQSTYHEKAYSPYIAFKTGDGEEITFLSNIGYGKNFAFNVGDKIPVLYLRSNPQTAMVNSLLEMFVLPLVLFGFGGVFWVVGIIAQFIAEPAGKGNRRRRTNV